MLPSAGACKINYGGGLLLPSYRFGRKILLDLDEVRAAMRRDTMAKK